MATDRRGKEQRGNSAINIRIFASALADVFNNDLCLDLYRNKTRCKNTYFIHRCIMGSSSTVNIGKLVFNCVHGNSVIMES